MKAQLHIPLGNKKLIVEGEGTQQQIMKGLSFWSNLPEKCGACGDSNINLNYRKPKGYDYYGLQCKACEATINFGQTKEDGMFFIKFDAKWEVYKAGDKPKTDNEPPAYTEDVPF